MTTYEARRAFGNTGDWRVLELPGLTELARYPTVEAAQAYALALGQWQDQRPDPATLRPFFAAPLIARESTYEGLMAILERAERPERIGL